MDKISFDSFKSDVCKHLDIDSSNITCDSVIYQDIGIDSLGLVNLGVKLQSEYNIEISAAEFIELRTVGELYECVLAAMQ